MTTRHDIIWKLKEQSMSVRELCRYFNTEKKETIEDLKHISKSILPKNRLLREDAVCNGCGFVFKDRIKLSTPTKCPKCRHESMTEVRFRIK
jgi:predicted Zn-ribbon and HTH transcriptional regulator